MCKLSDFSWAIEGQGWFHNVSRETNESFIFCDAVHNVERLNNKG